MVFVIVHKCKKYYLGVEDENRERRGKVQSNITSIHVNKYDTVVMQSEDKMFVIVVKYCDFRIKFSNFGYRSILYFVRTRVSNFVTQ